jgi:hydroxypyruvate isomerase
MKQSISWWCFDDSGLTPEQLVGLAVEIGYTAFDLVEQAHWQLIKDNGLAIAAIKGQSSIVKGFNHQSNHDDLEREVNANLELARKWEIPHLIVFSGNREGIDDESGAETTALGLQRLAGAAEDAGVNLLIELLNSKIDHPDYQADRTAWGVKVCSMVNSPRVRLLYDIYHMQIMEGDIIRTIRTYAPFIAHYHTAGNPGRNEIGGTQELHYPAIMRAIAATGYDGYIGQELVPAGDPAEALREAFTLCDVNGAR